MSLSNYAAQALWNSLFGKSSNFGALASRPVIYVGLSTTPPTEGGTNVSEPSGSGYARVSTSTGDWSAATNADPTVVNNVNDLVFPEATGSWGACTHFVLFDGATGGNVLASAALGTAQTPVNGTTPRFAAGSLVATLD